MYVCTFHGSIFLFCAYRVFFHWPTHFKDWKSFVVLHCELLCFKSLIGQTIYFHSCTFSMAKMYNSKYWYFVMSSWFWAWCKHMREVGRNHVGKGKFMISGWCTWNHLILQHNLPNENDQNNFWFLEYLCHQDKVKRWKIVCHVIFPFPGFLILKTWSMAPLCEQVALRKSFFIKPFFLASSILIFTTWLLLQLHPWIYM